MSDITDREREDIRSSEFRPGLIAAYGLLAVIGIFTTFFAMNSLFVFATEDEVYAKVLSHPSSDLEKLRASEHDTLTTYKALEPAKGVYQIPIDRAMQLVVSDYAKRKSEPPAVAPVPAAPEAAPATPVTPPEGKTP